MMIVIPGLKIDPRKPNFGRTLKLGRKLIGFLISVLLIVAGCSTPTPPLPPPTPPADVSVRVAILTPMTGELATFGETVRNGVTLAFEEWNERGGINGQPITWVLEDTRCDPLEARRAAERVILEQKVRFIVGGLCSESAIPIARVADERGALFVAATATHPLVTVDGDGATRSLVFRAAYAYPYQARAAARFALDELNARRAAALTNPGDDFVRSLVDEFETTFIAGGGQVVAAPTYSLTELQGEAGDAQIAAMVADVTTKGAQVLYVPDGYPLANRVGNQVRIQALDLTLIGSELWDNGALSLEVVEGAFFTLHYSRQTPGPEAEAWRERYLSAFAVEPDTLAALGYDAAGVLASGMRGVGSTSPRDVARHLETVEYEGVTGRWRFDAQHNPLKPVVVVQVRRDDIAFYDLVRP